MTEATTSPRFRGLGRIIRLVLAVLFVGVLAIVPSLHRSVGPIFPGPLDSVGTLYLLSQMMVIGALAMTLYLLIGVTGVLSFGHALYFALGAYGTVMIANATDLPFVVAAILAVLLSGVVAFIVNGLALRAGVVGFSMITLAFAELMALSVQRNYLNSGGDQGITLANEKVPEFVRGLANTANLYWVALALVVVVYVVVRVAESRTKFGRVWISIRENELRTESLGFNVYGYKLTAAVFASILASVCGVVYALLIGGAEPSITHLLYSLGLVLMVILGGRGALWGALLGGVLYTYLTMQLPTAAQSDTVQALPAFLQIPLSQPEFILGVCFVLIILFLPGGIASGLQKLGRVRFGRGRAAVNAGSTGDKAASN